MDREQLKRGEPKVPGYRIEGVLGRGATGTVYRARQMSVDREVALKVLHPELVGAKGAERRLQREARATARLAHPHIISAFDMGVVDGMWWYAMELVDGVSLAEKIRERTLTEREALRLFIPLVEALQHAFERGVVHRDVKPANILVERGGRALLVDLGLAFADDDPSLTKSGATLGTPHYISPEQARDPSGADSQSDLWSLGATLYHAVCGRPPFSGDSVAEILSAVLYEPVPDPRMHSPALSSGFVLVLRKCLTRDRSKRYATPAELLADLEKIRERRAPAVKRRALEPLAHTRTRLLPVATAVVLVFAVGTMLGWLVWRNTDPRLGASTNLNTGGTASADDRLASIEDAVSGPANGLAAALERAVVLLRTQALDPDQLVRLEPLRADIERRLRSEESAYRREAGARIAALIGEKRFAEAEHEAESQLEAGLRARVGPGALPTDLRAAFDAWARGQAALARQERAAAARAFGEALTEHFDAEIAPKVNELKLQGEWRKARALLTTEARSWIDRVPAARDGLSEAEMNAAIARLQGGRMQALLGELDDEWRMVDAALVQFVSERVGQLETELTARSLVDAPSRLRQDVADELSRRRLQFEEMPQGLLRLGYEALSKGEGDLRELEARLALDDAKKGLFELEALHETTWRQRRYDEARRAFESALTESWLAPVKDTLALRVREATLLQELLDRAARAVRAREGSRLELRVGSIVLSGPVSQAADPVRSGFVITLDSGLAYSFALRQPEAPPTGSGPAVLGTDTLLSIAGIAMDDANSKTADRLLRALFLMREGDAARARAVINGGPLPRGDALVNDLEERLRIDLEHTQELQGERRAGALERLRLVRRELRSGSTGEAFVKRVESLLQESSEVLTDEEIRELRRARDEWHAQHAKPQVELTVAGVFAPTTLEELSTTRVRMRFNFDAARVGAFDPGMWIPEGIGWSAVRYARSDEDFFSRPAPTLVFKEPLRIQTDALDVRLRLDQLPEAPPDLVLVSCAGFHAVFVFTHNGTRGRCVVETGDPARAFARARNGEGKEIGGWRTGAALDLHFVVWRARGVMLVDVDGKRVDEFQRPAPRSDPAQSTLQIRSWQPIRLLSATIEASKK
ncbi:MAG: serine/threonine protein kinase [Planctomycetes bacterium]|nr:serine/threonine protein kinase [Planctomycetota bacterium]